MHHTRTRTLQTDTTISISSQTLLQRGELLEHKEDRGDLVSRVLYQVLILVYRVTSSSYQDLRETDPGEDQHIIGTRLGSRYSWKKEEHCLG